MNEIIENKVSKIIRDDSFFNFTDKEFKGPASKENIVNALRKIYSIEWKLKTQKEISVKIHTSNMAEIIAENSIGNKALVKYFTGTKTSQSPSPWYRCSENVYNRLEDGCPIVLLFFNTDVYGADKELHYQIFKKLEKNDENNKDDKCLKAHWAYSEKEHAYRLNYEDKNSGMKEEFTKARKTSPYFYKTNNIEKYMNITTIKMGVLNDE